MIHFFNPLQFELSQILNLPNLGILAVSVLTIAGINFKFRLVPYDSLFLGTFLKYLPWAIFQQLILILVIPFLVPNIYIAASIAVISFSAVYHFGNWKLFKLTFLFGLFMYPIYFLEGYSILYISVAHALGGSMLKLAGIEMRVWRFN